MSPDVPQRQYRLVRLRNGAHSVHSIADGETMHPGIGPAAEAEALYVHQPQLPERVAAEPGEFVLWDVGLGAGANAVTALRLIRQQLLKPVSSAGPHASARRVRVVSFDETDAALAFALRHREQLAYFAGCEAEVGELLQHRRVQIGGAVEIDWTLELGDFPAAIRAKRVAPHAIMFDPHSPRKNPAMWTVDVFRNLSRQTDPQRPCVLATFTRSTMARTAMLLGGFFVGVGHASGLKEETTVAANRVELLKERLDRRWLERAVRSQSAEPLHEPVYRQAPLSADTSEQLQRHPQFDEAARV